MEDRLQAILSDVEASESRFPVLGVLCRARAAGIPMTVPNLEAVARRFEKPLDQVESLADWIGALVSPPPGVVLYRCVSVSCAMNGAALLARELEPQLEALGARVETRLVHCLDQCDRGPSMSLGARIYVGDREEIVLDERPWREAPFGI